jgi:hypothetical protein
VPAFRIAWQHMRVVSQLHIGRIGLGKAGGGEHPGVSAMAIRAAEHHGFGGVHGPFVACRVAGDAAGALGIGLCLRLVLGGGRGDDAAVVPLHRLLAFRGRSDARHDGGRQRQCAGYRCQSDRPHVHLTQPYQ